MRGVDESSARGSTIVEGSFEIGFVKTSFSHKKSHKFSSFPCGSRLPCSNLGALANKLITMDNGSPPGTSSHPHHALALIHLLMQPRGCHRSLSQFLTPLRKKLQGGLNVFLEFVCFPLWLCGSPALQCSPINLQKAQIN